MNAIVLAGGLSRRMNGIPKPFLRLGGQTFLERILAVVTPLVDAVLIVTNHPEQCAGLGARVVSDEREGGGPLMGIYSGLKASSAEACFVTAADTPLLSRALVERLVSPVSWSDCDVRVPRWRGYFEPLCAVYARRCLPAIEETMEGHPAGSAAAPRITTFFPLVRVCSLEEAEVRSLDPEGLSFLNVNTQEDYERIRSM
jgi:molybdenum cofactor guanylyltransferase